MTVGVAAVVVTHFPDGGVRERLDRLREQVQRLAIIDNGSDHATLATLEDLTGLEGVTLHANGANLGVATALNQGVRLLSDEGFEWVLTLDQDSTVTPGCVSALTCMIADDVAMIGANRREPGDTASPHRWLRPKRGFPGFERVPCERVTQEGVTLVITSGTLMSTSAFHHLGPFRDDYFVDLVDFEFCLRARRDHFRILVSCDACIEHRVGSRSRADVLGVAISPTHHSPIRRYYLVRNAVATIRAYGRIHPHWAMYQVLAVLEVVLGIAIAEDTKLPKLRACWLGLWDGCLNRLGPARRRF